MRVSAAQRVVLRLGAGLILLAGVILVGVAAFAASGPAPGLTVVDGTTVGLPSPGLFGGATTVYGVTDDAGLSPTDLGCSLLTSTGAEQSVAKMSSIAVVGATPVTKDGQSFTPLFEVRSYTAGSSVQCSEAGSVQAFAVSAASTFGGLGMTVRLFAAGAAVVCFLVGGIALVVLRARPRA